MFNKEDGKALINIAKESILCFFSDEDFDVKEDIKEKFKERLGVFVTLKINNKLRGCIGFVEGAAPLYNAVIDAAKAAAFSDPRFMPLTKKELENLKVEISVLTKPELINVKKADEYIDKIDIGKDGLIIRGSYGSGLLLPQVAIEWKWDVKDFLENLCIKAGLEKDAWKELENNIYKFQAQVFEDG